MLGKTCMVTGGTSGMGQATACALARMGARVTVVGRNPQKAEAAVHQIRQQTGNPAIEFLLADLSSQRQVRRLAQAFKARHARLDVLVNNAAGLYLRRRESADGIEMTFALNHLGYFLLTNLLLDAFVAAPAARIVNVSSYGHKFARMTFDDLQGQRKYRGLDAYRQSKLANLLFTYELARRLAGTGVTANAVNPGLVATPLGFNNVPFLTAWMVDALVRLYGLAWTDAERGARTAIYLATSAAVEGVTGKYFEKVAAVPSSPASYDVAAAARLWQVSAELTGLAAT